MVNVEKGVFRQEFRFWLALDCQEELPDDWDTAN